MMTRTFHFSGLFIYWRRVLGRCRGVCRSMYLLVVCLQMKMVKGCIYIHVAHIHVEARDQLQILILGNMHNLTVLTLTL